MASVLDPTFYRTAAEAAAAPDGELAYVVAFDRLAEQPDALTVARRGPRVRGLRPGGWLGRLAGPGRRVPPLRLERLQQRVDARGA